ncbi:22164_t:CDS:2 [Cetraspora pellucida]|uniref:22164_t:CDS:1 n=1 Tax=Cetraspora pellucida TaxID=1433469 RepID=A0A9N9DFP2_9GLOM|nr:22164_t:CDS:2 [Cetraspora pellucida]
MLNNTIIKAKDIHDLVKEGECKEFEIFYLNSIHHKVKILLEEIEKFSIRLCGAYEIGVKEVSYSLENKIKFPG